jgi:molecular chaperone GrpE
MTESENVRPEHSDESVSNEEVQNEQQLEHEEEALPDADETVGADPIVELQNEIAELQDQLLRKQADFDNFRKRMIRDREEAVQFANQQLLLDLTSIIDDFERAVTSVDETTELEAFKNGVALIEKQLIGMLERKWGLMRFDSLGQEFDPQRHEAVTTEPRDDHETSMVLEDYQKGYLLNDRVLRSAKVKVSMPAGQ